MCFYGYRYIQASQHECANAFTYGHDLGLVGTLIEVQYGVSYRYMLTVPIRSVSTCFYDYRYIQASGLDYANAFTYSHDLYLVRIPRPMEYWVSHHYILTVPIRWVPICFYGDRYVQASHPDYANAFAYGHDLGIVRTPPGSGIRGKLLLYAHVAHSLDLNMFLWIIGTSKPAAPIMPMHSHMAMILGSSGPPLAVKFGVSHSYMLMLPIR